MTTIGEILEKEKDNYTEYEAYEFTGNGIRHIHTDCISDLPEDMIGTDMFMRLPVDESEYWIMDADEYNRTVLANTSETFNDMFIEDDKILVILVSGTTYYFPNLGEDEDLFDLGSFDEREVRNICDDLHEEHPHESIHLMSMDVKYDWSADSELLYKAE